MILNDFISRIIEKRDISKIRQSGLVDHDWYLNNHPDLLGSNIDAVEHYYLFGWREGRNPNEFFDTNWFCKKNKVFNICPILYYMKNWRVKQLNTSEFFNIARYMELNLDVYEAGVEPLSHYINFGKDEGREICGKKNTYKYELREYIQTNLFLKDWYGMIYEDLRDSGIDLLEHFAYFGEKEGRNPNPYFDTDWYKSKYANEIDDCSSPLLFYANKGWKLGHSPSQRFDASKYIKEYGLEEYQEPLSHFLTKGKKLNYKARPCVEIDTLSKRELKFEPSATITQDVLLRALIENKYVRLNPESYEYNDELNIHWVIPDFSPGSGGHMTIFRIIRLLEIFGHSNTIWIYAPALHDSEEGAYQDIIKHFQLIKSEVMFTNNNDFINANGDIIFATDWGSVSFVNSLRNFKRRFYFVQDHEPDFYAQGSYAIASRNTYNYDLDCICASPWLRNLIKEKYGRWTREFWLSVDFNIYSLPKNKKSDEDIIKIAFYARYFTSRRAVELGFLALEVLAKRRKNIEVHCFGSSLPFTSSPFKCIDHGICNIEELAEIYQQCDIGIVFSSTNYSLIPQEMMACGLPVAELDVESTRAIFPKGVVTFLPTEPRKMAERLEKLIMSKTLRSKQAIKAYEWVNVFTWENAAKSVESAIFERLNELGFKKKIKNKEENRIKASVIIPTWNAGEIFKKVIKCLERQVTPWEYEILVVDSGSTDGTVEFLEHRHSIKLHRIPNSEFQHGRTRNLAISLTKGEFIAILTQDALPVDEYWLYNMVTSLEHYPDAAGVFGKHLAWPEADPYTKRDLSSHFENFENYPYCVSKNTNRVKWACNDLSWRQFLHFYSDNNSMIRRSVWEKIPYPEIEFGEDQAWAMRIIQSGYQKVYSKQGAVYHSHDFDEGDIEKRAFEEAKFFREEFGYKMLKLGKINDIIKSVNDYDLKWGRENNIPYEVISKRLNFNFARISGLKKGQCE